MVYAFILLPPLCNACCGYYNWVLGLIDFKEMVLVWKINRNEGIVSLLTFLLTLFFSTKSCSCSYFKHVIILRVISL